MTLISQTDSPEVGTKEEYAEQREPTADATSSADVPEALACEYSQLSGSGSQEDNDKDRMEEKSTTTLSAEEPVSERSDPKPKTTTKDILSRFSNRNTKEAAKYLLEAKLDEAELKLLILKLLKYEEAQRKQKRRREYTSVAESLAKIVATRQEAQSRPSNCTWSRKFQKLLALPDSIDKFRRLDDHAQSFLHTAGAFLNHILVK